MKTTITLKEFSGLPSGAVQIRHTTARANADSQTQPTTESVNGFDVPPEKSGEWFRELQHQRRTTPFVIATSYRGWGINE